MRFRPQLRMSVTRRENKEQRLKEFIGQHFSNRQSSDAAKAPVLLIVARSAESPVIKAVAGLAVEIAPTGAGVRMILAQADRDGLADLWTPTVEPAALDYEVRWARDPRLLEAHEQLVLGPQTCWVGDSMRREPAKCDAFETYTPACAQAAYSATLSFERLWIASEPLLQRVKGIGSQVAATSREPTGPASRH